MSDVSQTGLQEFLELFQNDEPRVTVRQAVVQTTLSSPNRVRIRIGGQLPDIDCRYLSSYAPTNGDTVWCIVNNRDVIVIGKLA